MKKWKIWFGILFIVIFFQIAERYISNEKQNDEITVQQLENLQSIPMVEFGRHIEYLCKEGRREGWI